MTHLSWQARGLGCGWGIPGPHRTPASWWSLLPGAVLAPRLPVWTIVVGEEVPLTRPGHFLGTNPMAASTLSGLRRGGQCPLLPSLLRDSFPFVFVSSAIPCTCIIYFGDAIHLSRSGRAHSAAWFIYFVSRREGEYTLPKIREPFLKTINITYQYVFFPPMWERGLRSLASPRPVVRGSPRGEALSFRLIGC